MRPVLPPVPGANRSYSASAGLVVPEQPPVDLQAELARHGDVQAELRVHPQVVRVLEVLVRDQGVGEGRVREELLPEVPARARAEERAVPPVVDRVVLVRVGDPGRAAEARPVVVDEDVAEPGVDQPPVVEAGEAVALPARARRVEEPVGELVVVAAAPVVGLGGRLRLRDHDLEVVRGADRVAHVGRGARAQAARGEADRVLRPAVGEVALEAEARRGRVARGEHVGEVGVGVGAGRVDLEGLLVHRLRLGGGGDLLGARRDRGEQGEGGDRQGGT